jgi:hypothetical protein
MGILVVVGFLFGMILGLVSPPHMDNSLLVSFLQFVMLTVSLQIGYVAGLAAGNFRRQSKHSKRLKNPYVDEISSSLAKTPERDRRAA